MTRYITLQQVTPGRPRCLLLVQAVTTQPSFANYRNIGFVRDVAGSPSYPSTCLSFKWLNEPPIMDHILGQAAEVRDGNIISYDAAIVSGQHSGSEIT